MMERAEKKKRKLAKHATRQRADAAKKGTGRKRASSLPGFADGGIASANTMADLRSGVASIIRTRSSTLGRQHSLGPTQSTKSQHIEEGVLSTPEGDIIEMDTIRPATATPPQESADISSRSPDNSRNIVSTSSETSSTSATPSIHVPRSVSQLLSFPTTWLQVYLRRVRRAHHDATRKLALERAERRQQMVAGEPNGDLSAWPEDGQAEGERTEQLRKARRRAQAEAAIVGADGIGWGLGSFGIKEHHESASRLQNARDRLQEDRLLSSTVDAEDEAGPSTLPNEGEPARIAEEDWEDVDDTTSSGGGPEWDDGEGGASRKKPPDRKDGSGAGWSWWGPLRDWRLADRSVF